jgi:hypothetical protein
LAWFFLSFFFCGSMFGWTCTLVTAFPVAIVATIREWPRLSGYADGSHVLVDVEVWERRGKSACEVLLMLFFGWRNMRCGRSSIAVTIPKVAFLVMELLFGFFPIHGQRAL